MKTASMNKNEEHQKKAKKSYKTFVSNFHFGSFVTETFHSIFWLQNIYGSRYDLKHLTQQITQEGAWPSQRPLSLWLLFIIYFLVRSQYIGFWILCLIKTQRTLFGG